MYWFNSTFTIESYFHYWYEVEFSNPKFNIKVLNVSYYSLGIIGKTSEVTIVGLSRLIISYTYKNPKIINIIEKNVPIFVLWWYWLSRQSYIGYLNKSSWAMYFIYNKYLNKIDSKNNKYYDNTIIKI